MRVFYEKCFHRAKHSRLLHQNSTHTAVTKISSCKSSVSEGQYARVRDKRLPADRYAAHSKQRRAARAAVHHAFLPFAASKSPSGG